MAEVDIATFHFRRDVGPFTVVGAWAKHADGQWRRCLVLMLKGLYGTNDLRVATVFDDVDLPNWALDAHGYGDAHIAMQMARIACDQMGIAESNANKVAVITAVNDHLHDLIMMPPRPPAEQVTIADIVIRDETGRRFEKELRTDV